MKLKSINPYTDTIVYECDELSDKQIESVLGYSKNAFENWKLTSLAERAKLMTNTSDILLKEKERLAHIITIEMGKPIKESRSEINKCAWVCKYYSENAEQFLQPRFISTDAKTSYIRYDPLGTILGIMPWNFPFWQVFRFVSPTLMAGNTILLKHASNVQQCAMKIHDIFRMAGFPEKVFQSLAIGSGKVKQLIESEVVKAVTLTGSEIAGASVAEVAGKHIKKTVLELGGSNAFIVLKDADLVKAVEIGVQARMINGGQSCIAAKRFIVHEMVAEEYIKMLKIRIRRLKVGDPFDEKTDLGPLASKKTVRTGAHTGYKIH
ncbi:Succinate-semialdehyde dehydrogenase [NADP(+)] 1 [subsurface metagenome]